MNDERGSSFAVHCAGWNRNVIDVCSRMWFHTFRIRMWANVYDVRKRSTSIMIWIDESCCCQNIRCRFTFSVDIVSVIASRNCCRCQRERTNAKCNCKRNATILNFDENSNSDSSEASHFPFTIYEIVTNFWISFSVADTRRWMPSNRNV